MLPRKLLRKKEVFVQKKLLIKMNFTHEVFAQEYGIVKQLRTSQILVNCYEKMILIEHGDGFRT